jgi:hypothetical protein
MAMASNQFAYYPQISQIKSNRNYLKASFPHVGNRRALHHCEKNCFQTNWNDDVKRYYFDFLLYYHVFFNNLRTSAKSADKDLTFGVMFFEPKCDE